MDNRVAMDEEDAMDNKQCVDDRWADEAHSLSLLSQVQSI